MNTLTPGGSEFVNDPEYCAKWAKEYIQSVPKQVLPFKQRADKLNEVNDSLLEALKNIVQDIEHYGEVKMRPSSTAINQAKAAIQKAEQ